MAFVRMVSGRLLGGGSNIEFLLELLQLKEHIFGSVGHIISEVCNGLNDVIDGIFECLSWLNWCVNRLRGASVAGGSISMSMRGCWV